RRGTSWLPSAPLAPATNTFMASPFIVSNERDEIGPPPVTPPLAGGQRGLRDQVLVDLREPGQVVDVVVEQRHLDQRLATELAPQPGDHRAVVPGEPAVVLEVTCHLGAELVAEEGLEDAGRQLGVRAGTAVDPVDDRGAERQAALAQPAGEEDRLV